MCLLISLCLHSCEGTWFYCRSILVSCNLVPVRMSRQSMSSKGGHPRLPGAVSDPAPLLVEIMLRRDWFLAMTQGLRSSLLAVEESKGEWGCVRRQFAGEVITDNRCPCVSWKLIGSSHVSIGRREWWVDLGSHRRESSCSLVSTSSVIVIHQRHTLWRLGWRTLMFGQSTLSQWIWYRIVRYHDILWYYKIE